LSEKEPFLELVTGTKNIANCEEKNQTDNKSEYRQETHSEFRLEMKTRKETKNTFLVVLGFFDRFLVVLPKRVRSRDVTPKWL
jgi:uncharacterized protein YbgA (DUF1722 family)